MLCGFIDRKIEFTCVEAAFFVREGVSHICDFTLVYSLVSMINSIFYLCKELYKK